MTLGIIGDEAVGAFNREGYVLVRGMLDAEETSLLARAAHADRVLDQHAFGRADGEGGTVRLALWNHPTETIYGMIARCQSIVGSMEKLLGGEVYHYHSKMIMKDARVGGAWTWHQDYGYWYQNGILYPLMASVFIAVDRATRENGCLQMVRGSHHMGRIDHVLSGEQAGADMAHVDQALQRLELVHVEMEPGDAVYFHCNTLHRSDQNRSQHPRWSMICSYNAARNDPFRESHHPRYTPLVKVPDSSIREYGQRRFAADEDQSVWLAEDRDRSAQSLTPR
jgi:ectoine hydroxylase-related dioxygenase (phytanoyl-CoA dioxygenase family)